MEGRKGSFTQWILRSDLCSCKFPEKLVPKSSQVISSKNAPVNMEQELKIKEPGEELPLDRFPTERFVPLKELGTGGSSSVYLSKDKLLDKFVAIKCLHNLSPEQAINFQNEARLNTLMNHPGIATVMDVGVAKDSTPYLVLEYVDGISLDKYITNHHPIAEEELVEIIEQVLKGADYAHSKGILHKDLKPANIILTKNQDKELIVKIIDFGSSIFENTKTDTGENTFVGTPTYMAPDEPRGHDYTVKSDIYSLGCIIYELITNKTPYDGESAVEILQQHNQAPIPLVVDRNELENLETFNEIIERALQKDPGERYESISHMLEDLKEVEFLRPDDNIQEIAPIAVEPRKSKVTRIILGTVFSAVAVVAGYSIYIAQGEKPVQKEKSVKKNAPQKEVSQKPLFVDANYKFIRPLSASSFKDEDLKYTPVDIRSLELNACMITGSGFKYLLEKDIQLRQLKVNSTLVSDENLTYLSKMPSLRYLSMSNCGITTKGIRNLGKLDLRNLYLSGVLELDDSSVEAIVEQFPNLRKLSLAGALITPKGLSLLTQLKFLKKLNLQYTDWSDKTIAIISKLSIDTLTIHRSPITDKELANFEKVANLKTLEIENCRQITKPAIQALRKKRPDLKVNFTKDLTTLIF